MSRAMGILVGGVVAAAIAVAIVVVLRTDTTGKKGSGLGEECVYDLSQYRKTDPSLIHYREARKIDTGFKAARGLAVSRSFYRIYVAGDKAIRVFDKDGRRDSEIELGDAPGCLALHDEREFATLGDSVVLLGDLTIYVGMKDHVEVYDIKGAHKASWESLGPKAVITSVAAAEGSVFVADAGSRLVVRYDTSGKIIARIGREDPERSIYGFIVPSAYFDLAVGPDGLLWVANPGRHRLEAWTFDGDLEHWWGKPSPRIEGFCGCCNPSHFAFLPDGRFVTSEKGLPRVKVYSPDGEFVSVVAGAEDFAEGTVGIDLATDADGRILVLDPSTKTVKVFVRKEER